VRAAIKPCMMMMNGVLIVDKPCGRHMWLSKSQPELKSSKWEVREMGEKQRMRRATTRRKRVWERERGRK